MFKLGANSKKNLYGVDTELYQVVEKALQISKIDFGIPKFGGIRTAEEQNELFKQNKSQLDGYEKESYHQSGKAFDVFAYVDGKASWDEYHLHQVATAVLQAASNLDVKLEWGGNWRNFVDMPHFQIPR